MWRSFPERLAEGTGRQVVAYDRLGFGRSDPSPTRPDLDFIAAEARDVVPGLSAQLGLSSFAACGHSVGGGMAVETAARLPDRCRALVTIAAQAFVEERTLDGIRVAEHELRHAAALARLAKYHGDKTRWVVDAWIETWLAPEFAGWSLDGALGRLRCPVLAIHGELDEYGSEQHPNRIAAGRGTALILPNIGHVPHRQDEALLVGKIGAFLGRI